MMLPWFRIFAGNGVLPDPAGIEANLHQSRVSFRPRYHADGEGWYRAEFDLGAGSPLVIERFLADEEGIRAELNSWAGHVESLGDTAAHHQLMERIIQSRQMFTLQGPAGYLDEVFSLGVCVRLCRHLAGVTEGFYQIDESGFHAPDATLLVADHP